MPVLCICGKTYFINEEAAEAIYSPKQSLFLFKKCRNLEDKGADFTYLLMARAETIPYNHAYVSYRGDLADECYCYKTARIIYY